MTSKLEKYHYVYRITNLVENKHYYGKRSCDIHPREDLGKKYFSSSTDKEFIKEQKEFPDRFKYKVIKLFTSTKEAVGFEIRLHEKFDVGKNPKFYNRCIQRSEGFSTIGMINVKDKNGNTFSTSINDPRYISGEIIGATTGFANVQHKNNLGIFFQVSVDDSRLKTGELVGIAYNKVNVVGSSGNQFQVSKDDSRYINRKLEHVWKDTRVVQHKDNLGVLFRVSINDPRLKSGELIGHWVGKTHSEDTKTKISNIMKLKQKGENNSQFGSMWIYDMETKHNKKVKRGSIIPEGYAIGRYNPPIQKLSEIDRENDAKKPSKPKLGKQQDNHVKLFNKVKKQLMFEKLYSEFKHGNYRSVREFCKLTHQSMTQVGISKGFKKYITEYRNSVKSTTPMGLRLI